MVCAGQRMPMQLQDVGQLARTAGAKMPMQLQDGSLLL